MQKVFTSVFQAKIMEKFDYSIIQLTDSKEVGPSLAFLAVTGLCEIDWDTVASSKWFPSNNKIAMVSRVGASALIIRKLVDGARRKMRRLRRFVPLTATRF